MKRPIVLLTLIALTIAACGGDSGATTTGADGATTTTAGGSDFAHAGRGPADRRHAGTPL